MKITKISLTNFRSFKSTQSIELAPVTLLFGPNSVGKSSVLMALAYVQQILRKGHCNPQKLEALGNMTIGGFRSLVHGQDTQQPIKIRLDFMAGGTPFVQYASDVQGIANIMQTQYVLMGDFGGSIENGAVEFEINWSSRHEKAFVKNYRVWINGGYIGCVSSSEDEKNTTITELNTQHPLLIPNDHEDWLETQYGPEDECELFENLGLSTEFELALNNLNPNLVSTAAFADIESAGENFINRIAPISIVCQSGAIPMLGSPIMTNLDGQDFDNSEDYLNFLVIREMLSQAFVLPLDKLLESIEKSVLIGPLRVVPDNDYVPNPYPEQADWVDGSAAWDMLHKDPNSDGDDTIKKLLRNTSEWFSSKDKLDSGYEIINRSVIDTLNLQDGSNPAMLGIINKRHVFFRELRTDIYLSANQLGTGISQVLPIVVASNYDLLGLISIEQPELHLHPRFQVELADLFLSERDKHGFLIETHSEHIVLRLLRRIRESSKVETVQNAVSPDDISVVYFSPTPNGTLAERLVVTSDGDFEDGWPHGFFDERDEELF